MADWIVLRLPRAADLPASWLLADGRGNPEGLAQSGSLALAADKAAGRRVAVLVPGADVLLTEPDVPTKTGTKLQQVVPYALEEQLADDIDALHFAYGRRVGDSSRVPVAVVRRALLDEWLSTLRSNGIEPSVLHADSDLLPHNPGQAVALMEEDIVVVRPPRGSPITLPVEALGEALAIAQQGAAPELADTGPRGLVLYTGPAEWHQHQGRVEALRERLEGIKVQILPGGPLALFAQQLATAAPINLLQGPYSPPKSSVGGLRAWRVAAILFGALIALHVVGKAAELSVLKGHERKLDSSIRDTFRTAMPGEQSTLNARRRMEQRLAETRAGGDGGLLSTLEALAQARSAAPGAVLQALSFHQGAVELKVSAPDAASLDRMSKSLRSNGWQADLTSGTVVGSAYEGRIQMRPN